MTKRLWTTKFCCFRVD